jgi:hypothetical protein
LGIAKIGRVAYYKDMEQCAILPDTNLALHFQPIEQIDWNALTGCSNCVVVVAPILFRELEKQKIFNKSPTLKARASRTIDFLVSKVTEPDPIPLRPGVTLAFEEHEPAIDFVANNLVREVDDDHHIAAALAFQHRTGLPTYIASNDGGLALKLRSRPIRNLRIPEQYRLPAEVEGEQKELREAKLELARLKAQKPKLAVRFANGDTLRTIRNAASIPFDKLTVEQVIAKYPPKSNPSEGPSEDAASLRKLNYLLGRTNAERYNQELRLYFVNYAVYFSEYQAWIETLRLTATLRIELINEGSATATDIDVLLQFPSGIKVLENEDWPTEPEEPDPPADAGSMALGGPLERLRHTPYSVPLLNVHDGAVGCSEDGRRLRFSAKSLKRGVTLCVDKFLLTRTADLAGKGAEIDVEITLHEGDPIHQKLNLRFEEVEVQKSDD